MSGLSVVNGWRWPVRVTVSSVGLSGVIEKAGK